MIRCDLRSIECSCEPTECRAAKPAPLAAEIMLVPVKTQLAVCLFLGVIAGISVFGILGIQEGYFKNSDLDCQERCVISWKR